MSKSTSELELLISLQSDKFDKEMSALNVKMDKLGETGKRTTGSIGDGWKEAAAKMGIAALAVAGLSKAFDTMIGKETSLAGFSALTGVTGDSLQRFGNLAEELAIKFGTGVNDQIDTFKGILSKLGPDMAKSEEAMQSMTDTINTLAVASGLTATDSMQALTNAVTLLGTDMTDPMAVANEMARVMNVMAAGAKEGSAEIPELNDAMNESLAIASSMGISIEGVVVALEAFDKAGAKGSQGGTAFRNLLAGLATDSKVALRTFDQMGVSGREIAELMKTDVSAGFALLRRGLQNVGTEFDQATAIANIWGKENQAAITGVVRLDGEMSKMLKTVKDTSVGYEQAGIMLDTTEKKWQRFTTFLESKVVWVLEGVKKEIVDIADSIERTFSGDTMSQLLSDMFGGGADVGMTAAIAQARKESEQYMDPWEKMFGPSAETIARVQKRAKELTEISKRTIAENKDAIKSGMGLGAFGQFAAEAGKAPVIPAGPKEGDVSPDGKMIFKNGAWVPKVKTGGGKGASKGKVGAEDLGWMKGYIPTSTEFRKTIDQLVSDYDTDFIARMGGIQMPDITERWATEQADAMTEFIVSMERDFKKVENLARAIEGVVSETFGGIGDAIGKALTGGEVDFKDTLKSILNTLLDFVEVEWVAAQAAATIRAFLTFGVSALADSWGWVASLAALELTRGLVNSFAVGTMKVPYDQTANIHKGEIIVPAPMSESIRRGEASLTGGGAGVVYRRATPQRMDIRTSVMFDEFARSSARAMSYNSRKVN